MKNWIIAILAVAVLAGCGGGEPGKAISSGGGGGTTRSVPKVTLSDNATVSFMFLSGLGRRAVGSQTAVISNVEAILASFTTTYPYYPSADVSEGGWTPNPLYSAIAKKTVDDTTYASYTTGTTTFQVSVAGTDSPPATGDRVVKIRAKAASSSSIKVELMQYGRRIGLWTHGTTSTWTTFVDTLSLSQVALISDYTALTLRVTAYNPGDCVSLLSFNVLDYHRMTCPDASNGSIAPISIQLDGYTHNVIPVTMTSPTVVSPTVYDTIEIEVSQFLQQTADGLSSIWPSSEGVAAYHLYDVQNSASVPFSVNLALLKGRQSVLQIGLDQDMLYVDTSLVDPAPVFDYTAFKSLNYNTTENAITSFLGDYVAFNITGIASANRPKLSTGSAAEYVLFSGDAYAVALSPRSATSTDTTSNMEIKYPIFIDTGVLRGPADVNGSTTPGSYTMLEPDPRDLLGQGIKITSLQGIYHEYYEVLSNLGSFVVVALPNSRSTSTLQCVAFAPSSDGTNVTSMYSGTLTLNGSTGTFSLAPISQLGQSSPSGTFTGTASNLTKTNGVVYDGDYVFSGQPSGVPSKGSFVVFIK